MATSASATRVPTTGGPAVRTKSQAPFGGARGSSSSAGATAWVVGLAFIVVPLWHDLWTYDQYELPKSLLLRVFTGVALVAAAVSATQRGVARPAVPFAGLLGAFTLAHVVATVLAPSPWMALTGHYESHAGLASVLPGIGLFLAIAVGARTKAAIEKILDLVLVGVALVLVMALLQRLGWDLPRLLGYSTRRIDPNRIGTTLGNPNFLACYLTMAVPLIIHRLRTVQAADRQKYGALLAFALFVLAMTGSRTGPLVLGLFAVVAGVAYGPAVWRQLSPPQRQTVMGAFAVVAAATVFVSYRQLGRFAESLASPFKSFTEHRSHLWEPAIDLFFEHPWLGVGPDGYRNLSMPFYKPELYQRLGYQVAPLRPHNDVLGALTSLGVVGFVAYLAFWVAVVVRPFRWPFGPKAGSPPVTPPPAPALAKAAAWCVAAGFLYNVLNFYVVVTHGLMWVFAAIAVVTATDSAAGGPAEREADVVLTPLPPGLGRAAATLGAVLAGALTLFCAWDFVDRCRGEREFFKGVLTAEKGRYTEALPLLRKAVERRPYEPKYTYITGQVAEAAAFGATGLAKRKLLDESLAQFENCLYWDITSPTCLAGKGRILVQTNRPEEGLALLRHADAEAPSTITVKKALLDSLIALRMCPQALEVVRQYAEQKIPQTAAVASRAGLDCVQTGNRANVEAAAGLFDLAVAAKPKDPDLFYNRGLTLEALERLDEAAASFRQAVALKPGHTGAVEALGHIATPTASATPGNPAP